MEDFRLPAPLVGLLKLSKLKGIPNFDIRHKSESVEVTIFWKRGYSSRPKAKVDYSKVYIDEDNTAGFQADDKIYNKGYATNAPADAKGCSQGFIASEFDAINAPAYASTTDGVPGTTRQLAPQLGSKLSPINANPPPSPMEQEESSSRYDAAARKSTTPTAPKSKKFQATATTDVCAATNVSWQRATKQEKIFHTPNRSAVMFQLTRPGMDSQYIYLDLIHDKIATLYKNKDSKFHTKAQWNQMNQNFAGHSHADCRKTLKISRENLLDALSKAPLYRAFQGTTARHPPREKTS